MTPIYRTSTPVQLWLIHFYIGMTGVLVDDTIWNHKNTVLGVIIRAHATPCHFLIWVRTVEQLWHAVTSRCFCVRICFNHLEKFFPHPSQVIFYNIVIYIYIYIYIFIYMFIYIYIYWNVYDHVPHVSHKFFLITDFLEVFADNRHTPAENWYIYIYIYILTIRTDSYTFLFCLGWRSTILVSLDMYRFNLI